MENSQYGLETTLEQETPEARPELRIAQELEEGIHDPFWGNDFTVLFRKDRLIEFFPTVDMTDSERLNSIARFSIYTGILLALFNGKIWPLYIGAFGLGFTLFIWKNKDSDDATIRKIVEFFNRREVSPQRPSRQELEDQGTYLSSDECTLPTQNNPFMNITVNEYKDNPQRGEACDYFDSLEQQGVKNQVDNNFNYNLYKDVSDLFDKNNSQRQFYTMPVTTIPNKQDDFAHWLYGNASSAKDNRYDNIPYERLQQNRFIWPNPEQNPVTSKRDYESLPQIDQQQA